MLSGGIQRTGRRNRLQWMINCRQPSSWTSWTLLEHQPGTNGKQTGRLLNSPLLTAHRNCANHHHHHRRQRKPGRALSFRDSVGFNLGTWTKRRITRIHVTLPLLCSQYNRSLGHLALSMSSISIGRGVSMPPNTNSIKIYTTPPPPTLHRFPVPPLPIPRQITLGFLPPLYNLLITLGPVEFRRLRVQTFLLEHVHDVLDFRVPAFICSFLLREGKEQGLTRVEGDLRVGMWCSCG